MRATLLEGLSKPTPLDNKLLSYFNQSFKEFTSQSDRYSSHLIKSNETNPQAGFEDLFSNLYMEGEFADLYTRSYIEYTKGTINWL